MGLFVLYTAVNAIKTSVLLAILVWGLLGFLVVFWGLGTTVAWVLPMVFWGAKGMLPKGKVLSCVLVAVLVFAGVLFWVLVRVFFSLVEAHKSLVIRCFSANWGGGG